MLGDIILLRARERNEHNQAFADDLRKASGCVVRFLLDERGNKVPSADPEVLSLNQESYASLGVYAPPDVAWRCGDYGAYLAWRGDPSRPYYWVIEDDVRIAGDAKEFFRLCRSSSSDFLVAHLRKTVRGNFWWPHTISKDVQAFACLFPLTRLSNRAVEACYNKRKKHTRQLSRRALWPNDEGLVATTVAAKGFFLQDFNDLQPDLWDEESYSVTGLPRTSVDATGVPKLIHPVRFKERSAEHVKQTSWENVSSLRYRIMQFAMRQVNAHRQW